MNIIPPQIIQKAVETHGSDYYSKGLTIYVQMLSMIFYQLSKSNSLREIEYGMQSTLGDWNHLGACPREDSPNILVDEILRLTGEDGSKNYPPELRRLVIYDEKNNELVEILTNNFSWTALSFITNPDYECN